MQGTGLLELEDIIGKKPIQSGTRQQGEDTDALIAASRIDLSVEIEEPPIILSVRERYGTSSRYIRLFTLGNFSAVIGKMKTKKTFLVTLLTASLLREESMNEKFLGSLPADKPIILYFDTEQGSYDSYNCVKRIQRMTGDISNLQAFSLRAYKPETRCRIIERVFELNGQKVGYCVIDGIADLAFAINDELEATRVSTMLLRLTKDYHCHITTVIHQNKQDNFATGHLGSSIMKKAEIIIEASKNTANKYLTDVASNISRGPEFEPFCIGINERGLPYVAEDGVANAHANETFRTDELHDNEAPF